MAVIGKPFKDAKAKVGKPKLTSKRIAGSIQFKLHDGKHLELVIPKISKKRHYVSKKYLIELAHWLLDKCTDWKDTNHE